MKKSLKKETDSEYEMAFINTAIKAFEDCRLRQAMDPGPGYYRAINAERKADIEKFYNLAAMSLYKGFVLRMEKYAGTGDSRQQRIAKKFEGIKTSF